MTGAKHFFPCGCWFSSPLPHSTGRSQPAVLEVPDDDMRIATWNLESLKQLTPERDAAFRLAMARIDADVWVLTETWNDLPPLSDYQLVAQSGDANDLKRWPNRCWVSIWGKSSLAANGQVIHGQADRMACGWIKIPGQRDIVVVGTVLPWRSDTLWPGDVGFGAALACQAEECGAIRGRPDTCDFVLAGDFNQSLPHRAYYGSKKGENALNDAFQRHDLVCLTAGNDPITDEPRIDHICVGRSSLKSSRIPHVGAWAIPSINDKPITDHAGVFAELDLFNFL
ncbi:MAG TPA: endonuclease/exonuclease/phosphatase family protein [Pirellulales bacterium]